jgi:hypothetical protein
MNKRALGGESRDGQLANEPDVLARVLQDDGTFNDHALRR